jgi:hypothetical protein
LDKDPEIKLPDVTVMDGIIKLSEALSVGNIEANKVAFKISKDKAALLAVETLPLFNNDKAAHAKLKLAIDNNYTNIQMHKCTILGIEILVEGMT